MPPTIFAEDLGNDFGDKKIENVEHNDASKTSYKNVIAASESS